MQTDQNNFTSIHTPRAWAILFGILFLLKFLILYYLSSLAKCDLSNPGGFIFLSGGDTSGYLVTVENYITQGTYYIFNGIKNVYAGRMPYYGVLYFILRQFFSVNGSYDALVIIQIALESLSIVCLSAIALKLLKSTFSFWFTLVFSLISLNVSYWSVFLLPESLSVSFLLFSVYFYLEHKESGSKKHYYLFSLFLVLLIVLKPYFAPLIGFVFLDLLTDGFSGTKLYFAKACKLTFITCCMLLLFLSPWIVRNYLLLHKFIPLQEATTAEYHYTDADFACRRFIQAWGGNAGVFWDKKSAACYFMLHPTTPCDFVLPDYVSANGYSITEVDRAKDEYIRLQLNYSDSLNTSVTKEFDRLTGIYKQEKTFRYYVISPLLIAKNFLFHSGSYYLPISPGFKCYHSYQFIIKLSQSLLYYCALLLGFAGLIFLFLRNRSTAFLLVIPLFIIAFFCFYLRACEYRYFIPAYPFLVLGTTYIFGLVKNNIPFRRKFHN